MSVPTQLSLGPVVFHLYGLILGTAIIIVIQIAERKAVKQGIPASQWWRIALGVVVSGFIGARLYYVMLHWSQFVARPWEVFAVWHGGTMIIGGLLAGVVAAWLLARRQNLDADVILDAAAFGLPIGQAIGRTANAVNQELYGLPTTLPWGIPIDPAHRVSGYEHYTYFHPLFLYEAVCLLLLAVWMWWREQRATNLGIVSGWQIGSGNWWKLYILYYSIIRFLLDFIRINKTHLSGSILSISQLVIIVFWVSLGIRKLYVTVHN